MPFLGHRDDGVWEPSTLNTLDAEPSLGAVEFDGVTDWLDMGAIFDGYDFRTQAFGVSFWMRTTDTSAFLMACMSSGGAFPGWGAYVVSTGQPSLYLRQSHPGQVLSAKTSTAYNDGQWHHCVVTYDGSNAGAGISAWCDAVAEAMVVMDNLPHTAVTTAGVNMTIGSRGAGNLKVAADLADIRVFERELTQADVNTLFTSPFQPLGDEKAWWGLRGSGAVTAGAVTDSSASGYDASAVNGTPVFVAGHAP